MFVAENLSEYKLISMSILLYFLILCGMWELQLIVYMTTAVSISLLLQTIT